MKTWTITLRRFSAAGDFSALILAVGALISATTIAYYGVWFFSIEPGMLLTVSSTLLLAWGYLNFRWDEGIGTAALIIILTLAYLLGLTSAGIHERILLVFTFGLMLSVASIAGKLLGVLASSEVNLAPLKRVLVAVLGLWLIWRFWPQLNDLNEKIWQVASPSSLNGIILLLVTATVFFVAVFLLYERLQPRLLAPSLKRYRFNALLTGHRVLGSGYSLAETAFIATMLRLLRSPVFIGTLTASLAVYIIFAVTVSTTVAATVALALGAFAIIIRLISFESGLFSASFAARHQHLPIKTSQLSRPAFLASALIVLFLAWVLISLMAETALQRWSTIVLLLLIVLLAHSLVFWWGRTKIKRQQWLSLSSG